jgi:thioredoxin reductase (NADPH)
VAGDQRTLALSDGRQVSSRAVIIATGARYRRLGIPSLEALVGTGVYYTTFDSRLARGQDVHVAGGGNSAGQAAVYLARHARHVTLLVRADALEKGMSDYLVQQIRQTANIEVRLGCEITGGGGAHRLESLTLSSVRGAGTETVPARMLFVLIGALPHTDWLAGTQVRDDRGFILTGADLPSGSWPLSRRPKRYETSLPGVFAAGDVRHASSKRVASAVGEGSVAVQYVHEYLTEAAAASAAREAAPARAPAVLGATTSSSASAARGGP